MGLKQLHVRIHGLVSRLFLMWEWKQEDPECTHFLCHVNLPFFTFTDKKIWVWGMRLGYEVRMRYKIWVWGLGKRYGIWGLGMRYDIWVSGIRFWYEVRHELRYNFRQLRMYQKFIAWIDSGNSSQSRYISLAWTSYTYNSRHTTHIQLHGMCTYMGKQIIWGLLKM